MADNYVEILVKSRDQAKPDLTDLKTQLNDLSGRVAEARAMVDDTEAAAKLDALQAKLLKLDRTTARANINMESAVRAEGQLHSFEAQYDKVIKDLETPPKDPFDNFKKNAQDAANGPGGISPLLIGAFTAAGTIGPAALLAGVATGVTGVEALFARSNAQVAQDASNLSEQVKTSLTDAVSPITGDVDAGIIKLEQGVSQLTPQLDQLFAVAGPDATELASGLDQLAEGALPGIVSGVKAIAPEMHDVAADFGKIGQGLGGFVGGLSSGAAGSTTAFNALAKSLSEILPDLGQTIGMLSNGLGPALADVLPVVNATAKGVELFTSVLSPGEIQAAALAVGALGVAFKASSMAGLLEEGTKFTGFLSGSAKASAEAEGAVKSFASKGVGALSAALDVATGPLGLIIAGAGLLGDELGKLSGVGDHTTANVDALTSAMADAANGSAQTQGNVNELANAFTFMATGPLHATNGLKSMDDALVKLSQSNPQQAAQEFTMLSKSLEANGVSADQVAKDFPQYSQAVADAKLQSHLLGSQTDQLTASLLTASDTARTNAQSTAQQTLALLGAKDGQDKLTQSVYNSVTAYETASGQAGAYKTALDALYGKYQDYSQAEATFTTDLDNASKSLTKGKDAINLNTAAGAANFTVLSGLATQNEQVAESLLKQSGSQDKANKALQEGALKIDALAKSAGFTDGQIAQLNTDLYGTASIKDISVTVTANTAPAYKGVDELLNFVNSSGATIHVYASDSGVHNTGMSAYAKGTGGVVGLSAAATGGIRSNRVLVGEYGPEVADLPVGTMVHSASDTQRLLSQQGAAGARGGGTEVSFAGDVDTAFATAFMLLVRKGKIQIKQKAIVT